MVPGNFNFNNISKISRLLPKAPPPTLSAGSEMIIGFFNLLKSSNFL